LIRANLALRLRRADRSMKRMDPGERAGAVAGWLLAPLTGTRFSPLRHRKRISRRGFVHGLRRATYLLGQIARPLHASA